MTKEDQQQLAHWTDRRGEWAKELEWIAGQLLTEEDHGVRTFLRQDRKRARKLLGAIDMLLEEIGCWGRYFSKNLLFDQNANIGNGGFADKASFRCIQQQRPLTAVRDRSKKTTGGKLKSAACAKLINICVKCRPTTCTGSAVR